LFATPDEVPARASHALFVNPQLLGDLLIGVAAQRMILVAEQKHSRVHNALGRIVTVPNDVPESLTHLIGELHYCFTLAVHGFLLVPQPRIGYSGKRPIKLDRVDHYGPFPNLALSPALNPLPNPTPHLNLNLALLLRLSKE
jgi:hypothetical protein